MTTIIVFTDSLDFSIDILYFLLYNNKWIGETNEKNAILLGIDKFMDDYNKLKSTSSVDKAMMKEFESAEEFAKAFEKAVENYDGDKLISYS